MQHSGLSEVRCREAHIALVELELDEEALVQVIRDGRRERNIGREVRPSLTAHAQPRVGRGEAGDTIDPPVGPVMMARWFGIALERVLHGDHAECKWVVRRPSDSPDAREGAGTANLEHRGVLQLQRALGRDDALDEHSAGEVRGERCGGVAEHLVDIADLLHGAGFDDRDAVGECEEVDWIVRDEHDRYPNSAQFVEHKRSDADRAFNVERRERLVEQHRGGIRSERARDRNALLLTTREGVRAVPTSTRDADPFEPRIGVRVRMLSRNASGAGPERNILSRSQVRKEPGALIKMPDVALRAGDVHGASGVVTRKNSVAEANLATGDAMLPRNGADETRLACSVRADDAQYFAGGRGDPRVEPERPAHEREIDVERSCARCVV